MAYFIDAIYRAGKFVKVTGASRETNISLIEEWAEAEKWELSATTGEPMIYTKETKWYNQQAVLILEGETIALCVLYHYNKAYIDLLYRKSIFQFMKSNDVHLHKSYEETLALKLLMKKRVALFKAKDKL